MLSDERLAELLGEWSGDIRDRVDPEYWRQKELLDEIVRLRAENAELKREVHQWIEYGDNRVDVIGVYQARVATLEGVLRECEVEGRSAR